MEMKKMVRFGMFVAAAAMTFAGCSKEDITENGVPAAGTKVTHSFVAEFATSRTTLNDAMTRMVWSEGDQLGIYTDVETDLNVASSVYAEGDGKFTADIDAAATKVYAYYPYYKDQGSRKHTAVSLYIEDAQNQTEAGVLNGNMVGMYASAAIAGEGQNTVLTFDPIASIIAFNIYDLENSGEAVKSVTFSPAGGEKLNGQHIYDLETGTTSSTGTKTSATVTLTTPYVVPAAKPADKSGYIYLAVSPKNYSGGTITVVTDKNTYTFETTKALDLTNVYAPLTIPMNLAAGTTAEDYSGTYVVLAKESSSYFALASTNNNSDTRLDAVVFEYNGSDPSVTVTEPELLWTVTKNGNVYTFSNNGKYLSYSGSKNTAKIDDTPYNLFILKDATNGTYNIKSEVDPERILAKYNDQNIYFAFYATGGNNDLYLVPAEYKSLPIIDLSTTSAILDYNDESEHEITATVTDATSVVASAYATEDGSVECDWLSASYENGIISYSASVNNTDMARTAYIIVSATNANGTRTEIITVVQNIQAQGTEVTFNYGVLYSAVTTNQTVTEDTVDGVTAQYVKISGPNPPKYYNNGKNLRIYKESTMTISAPTGSSIIKIEFTASTWTADKGTVTVDVGTLTSKTWTGESESVVFTFTASNRIESFVVTYK